LGFEIQDVWKSAKEEFSSITGSHHGRSMPSRPNSGDIMMHDVNVEEKTKVRCQSLALSLFSSI